MSSYMSTRETDCENSYLQDRQVVYMLDCLSTRETACLNVQMYVLQEKQDVYKYNCCLQNIQVVYK